MDTNSGTDRDNEEHSLTRMPCAELTSVSCLGGAFVGLSLPGLCLVYLRRHVGKQHPKRRLKYCPKTVDKISSFELQSDVNLTFVHWPL